MTTWTAEVCSDTELVLAARRREPGAYGELFRRWYSRSYDVALNILRDREAAADSAQDAFVAAWQRLDDLRDPEAFGGWLLRITRNRALNRLTRDRHRTVQPLDDLQEILPLPDPESDPALQVERSDQRRLIWTAVAALGERDNSLLDLHLRHGLAPAEIAEELQITANNAKQLLFRLRQKLRDVIGAALLWRDGKPTCPGLATLLVGAGSFDGSVASTIRRHQRDCSTCLREIARGTRPERLFAAVPVAVAPLVFMERAQVALTRAGVPMAPSAGVPVPAPATAALRPSTWAPRALIGGAAVVGLAVLAIAVWPGGPGRGPSAAGGGVPGATPSTPAIWVSATQVPDVAASTLPAATSTPHPVTTTAVTASSPVTPSGVAATGTGTSTATATAHAASCTYAYRSGTDPWGFLTADITLTNASSTTWSGWTATFSITPSATIMNAWGGRFRVSGTRVTVTSVAGTPGVPPGAGLHLSFVARSPSPATQLSGFAVQGAACASVTS